MKCPRCGHLEDKVVDSRVTREGAGVRRRRECLACNQRFTTLEEIVPTELYVVKRDQSREEFDPAKVRDGLRKALWKRPVGPDEIDAAMQRLQQKLEAMNLREVPSETVGELVMAELLALDPVAYVRFASVYRKFTDVSQFAHAISVLDRKHKGDDQTQ